MAKCGPLQNRTGLGELLRLVGRTPCVPVRADLSQGARLFIKLEGNNPTGSVKDRACLHMVMKAKNERLLTPNHILLDASSGNMACSIAYIGHVLGYKTHIVSTSKLTGHKRSFIEYFGATIDICGEFTIEARERCKEIMAENSQYQYCFLDQLHNPANPEAHTLTTGPELYGLFPNLSAVVGSLGSGGTMVGVGRYLKERVPEIKLISVEAHHGVRLPGIGAFLDDDYLTPFIRDAQRDRLFDGSARVTHDDAMKGVQQLKDQGFFVGRQTGAVYVAAIRAIRRLRLRGDIVIISGDSGWKDFDKLRC